MKTYLALTYDDILLIPQYSDITTRSKIDLSTRLSRQHKLAIPYVASCMDTVCEKDMAKRLMEFGGVGCIHRFMSIEGQAKEVAAVSGYSLKIDIDNSPWSGVVESVGKIPCMAAVGANGDFLERAQELVSNGANVILIDVAHGHHSFLSDALSRLKKNLPPKVDVIGGNVSTFEGVIYLADKGADGIRVGVGGGSLCSTRIQTGHGVPNVTSIIDAERAISEIAIDVPIMADGGIRGAGDITKAIAVGAENVMLGSLFAGTTESPGPIEERGGILYKKYRGSASRDTKSANNQKARHIEGEATRVPYRGGVKFVIEELNDGVRSGFSYSGARNMREFQAKAVWNRVTQASIAENKPHLIS